MFVHTEWVPVGHGGRRKTIGDGENMTVLQIEFEAGGGVQPHNHPHEQVSYVVSGKMEFTANGETFVLNAGQSTVVPGGITHQATALEASVLIETFSPRREEFRK